MKALLPIKLQNISVPTTLKAQLDQRPGHPPGPPTPPAPELEIPLASVDPDDLVKLATKWREDLFRTANAQDPHDAEIREARPCFQAIVGRRHFEACAGRASDKAGADPSIKVFVSYLYDELCK